MSTKCVTLIIIKKKTVDKTCIVIVFTKNFETTSVRYKQARHFCSSSLPFRISSFSRLFFAIALSPSTPPSASIGTAYTALSQCVHSLNAHFSTFYVHRFTLCNAVQPRKQSTETFSINGDDYWLILCKVYWSNKY